jgi:hypothetical protein
MNTSPLPHSDTNQVSNTVEVPSKKRDSNVATLLEQLTFESGEMQSFLAPAYLRFLWSPATPLFGYSGSARSLSRIMIPEFSMFEMTVPCTSLRSTNSRFNDPGDQNRSIRIMHRYFDGELQVHVWKDWIVEGDVVVRSLIFLNVRDVVVVHRRQMPSDYPGDL